MCTSFIHLFNILQQMQAEMDGLTLETKRKESSITLLVSDKDKLEERLKEEEGTVIILHFKGDHLDFEMHIFISLLKQDYF